MGVSTQICKWEVSRSKRWFCTILCDRINGQTYYVAKTAIASDNNDDGSGHPFLAPNKAGSVAKVGDVAYHNKIYKLAKE